MSTYRQEPAGADVREAIRGALTRREVPSPLALQCLQEMDGPGTTLVALATRPTARRLVERLRKRVLELSGLEQAALLESEFPPDADLEAGPAQLVFVGGLRHDFQAVLAGGRLVGMIGYPAGGFISPARR